ncbi:hypothetical protein GCM10011371_24380 [Novosphingobium marinum]|uniref:WalW protein n=1 Tax=Novosphingobium marinum TaxID=1514948 RepID=A0A7Y9XXT0_9SPHN|nr:polysaccharide deacetylase family protein [Novosphingobium marinum]NYH96552.1 hypothetical protein [Novosphingobium marinum]GGC36119.1 hypothetical protein GCM10011371_24380 [Novosphingobium marinum]
MAGIDISVPPQRPDFVQFARGFGKRFILTVDTEEEFDWSAPLDRSSHSLLTVPTLRKFQQFCEGFAVAPIYLVDYPVASSPAAIEVLGEAVREGRADIGVQLHPWVNPPFDEELSDRNSFAGNLPPDLEREKFSRLRDLIEKSFGAAPLIYRAGRYGIGPNTAGMLVEGGIAIDTSVRSQFDYSYMGGPNFREHPLRPYWTGEPGGLMELPLTTVWWGMLRQLGPLIYPLLWRAPSLRGVLSRAGMLERIALTPEGITAEEAIRGIDIALDDGLPLLVLSFHSPSIAPGHTPYVRNEQDLDAFYDWWRTILGYLAQRGVAPASVRDIMDAVVLA